MGIFKAFCTKLGTDTLYTAPYSPEMNAVERAHRTLMTKLRVLRIATNQPWTECLYMACLSYNTSIHSMTEAAPFTLLLSLEVDIVSKTTDKVTDIAALRSRSANSAFLKRERRLEKVNRRRENQDIKVGDKVYLKALSPKKLEERLLEAEFTVIAKRSNNIFNVKDKDGRQYNRARKALLKL